MGWGGYWGAGGVQTLLYPPKGEQPPGKGELFKLGFKYIYIWLKICIWDFEYISIYMA